MGVVVEFNPDLALRDYTEFKQEKRKEEECVPINLEVGKVYPFLKQGQRNYWHYGEIPLRKTRGNQVLEKPIASIVIIEATHFLEQGKIFTKGKYKVVELFNDNKPHFNGFDRVK